MKTPNPQTVAAIVSEINAGMDESGDLTAHPFYDCMRDLLHMKEFRDFLGAFSMISFGDGYATEEDITVFGLGLFVAGIRVGRADAFSMEDFV